MEKELCIRCGKPTLYDINTPITFRRYFVEGSGQLCEECFHILYPVPGACVNNDQSNPVSPGKVVRIIQSYVGVVNKMVWRKY